MERQTIVQATLGREGFQTRVSARDHVIVNDEPRELGGEDAGPTPMEMLLASLASCTLITVRMYATRKAWALDRSTVEVRGLRYSPGPGAFEEIEVTLRFEGDLSGEQRSRLEQIAHACPVHKTLAAGVAVRTTLA